MNLDSFIVIIVYVQNIELHVIALFFSIKFKESILKNVNDLVWLLFECKDIDTDILQQIQKFN